MAVNSDLQIIAMLFSGHTAFGSWFLNEKWTLIQVIKTVGVWDNSGVRQLSRPTWEAPLDQVEPWTVRQLLSILRAKLSRIVGALYEHYIMKIHALSCVCRTEKNLWQSALLESLYAFSKRLNEEDDLEIIKYTVLICTPIYIFT